MGFLSSNRHVMSRQFALRKKIGEALILLTIGVLAVQAIYSVASSNTLSGKSSISQEPSARNHDHTLLRRKRDATSNSDKNATHKFCLIANETQNSLNPTYLELTAMAEKDSDKKLALEELDAYAVKFYNNFYDDICKLGKNESDKINRIVNMTLNDRFPKQLKTAQACFETNQKSYATQFISSGIYWCDDTSGLPTDLLNIQQRQQGGIILYFLGMVYMFYALAVVCDEYFVPALEELSAKLDVTPDIAGATFMAAGGSAPELFTSVIGVFLTESNVGIGTIVGSAVFNILAVLGACAFVVGMEKDDITNKPKTLNLTWFPILRDTVFYVVALVAVILAFTSGNDVNGASLTGQKSRSFIKWWEAFYMFTIYIAYLVFMKYNKKIKDLCGIDRINWEDVGQQGDRDENGNLKGFFTTNGALNPTNSMVSTFDNAPAIAQPTDTDYMAGGIKHILHIAAADADDEEVEMTFKQKIVYYLTLPLRFPMSWTIPDMTQAHVRDMLNGYMFILSFISSIVWIIIYSYLLVWWATRFGETFNIDSAIMGLTLLAAGTSVPDLITSILVARKGFGDMAVSSSIGSNIFDVTVGLPVPWLLKTLSAGNPVEVTSQGLGCSIGLLLIMLVTLIGSIISTGWTMNRTMGAMMIVLYIVFVGISLMFEFQVITCPF